MKRVICILPIFLLGACSLYEGESAPQSLEQTFVEKTEPVARVAFEQASAYASLPGDAEWVAGVSERRFGDGFIQEIRVAGGDPANAIELAVRTSAATPDVRIPLAKPTEVSIRAELSGKFPNVAMHVVTRPMRNAYGQYGLAVGTKSDGSRCVYVWQWLDDIGKPLDMRDALQGSLRVRLCRSKTTLDALASVAGGLRLGTRTYVANADGQQSAAVSNRAKANVAHRGPGHADLNGRMVDRDGASRRALNSKQSVPAPELSTTAGLRYIVPLAVASSTGKPTPPSSMFDARGSAGSNAAVPQAAALPSSDDSEPRIKLPPEAYGRQGSW